MQGEDFAAEAKPVATPAKPRGKRKKKVKQAERPDALHPSLDDAADENEPADHLADLEDAEHISDEEREKLRSKYLLDRFWQTARGFWRRGSDRLAWVLTIGLLVLILLNLATQYGINVWNRAIFDALEKHDSGKVFYFAMIFFPLAAVSVSIGVTNVYARMSTQRRWRAWMSKSVLDQWLKNGRYYQLNLVSGDHQNPEGRLTEDLRVSTDAPVDFTVGIVSATLSALTFITVLWTIGGALTIPIAGNEVTIPGFLVIAAVIYASVASGAMVFVANRFVQNLRGQEPKRSGIPICADARTRERREHRAARRRGRGTRRYRPFAAARVADVARPVRPAHARDHRLAGLWRDRTNHSDYPVRAEVPRRLDVARSGDAGGVRLHHRARGVQLAGGQLSATGGLERLRAPRRVVDGIARCAR